ncbi:UDP-3-O-(3-hydroxymyristoyl)glucosamine N-acyltransferase, partial [bacterium]|nr:UDP-3-O-(3-hydroxymyristoyl)glucosamine N-acyltransferase [bacterium]
MSPAPAPTLARIAEHVGGALEGSGDLAVTGVAGIDEAGPGELTFVANPKYAAALKTTRASAVLLAPGMECPSGIACVRTPDPYAALVRVLMLFDPGPPPVPPGVHPTAVVAEDAELGEGAGVGPHAVVEAGARLGKGTRIAANAYVGHEAVLGDGCYLHPQSYVGRRCRLGHRVVLYPGAIVGSDGFGYAPVEGRYHKIPQLGIVDLGDDVEVGANACIDRATMGCTRIGRGTKIDNLVQVAHNVAIGEDGVIAAQAGISGSTRIGDRLQMGGQVGVIGHLRFGNDVTASAKSGVIGNLADGVM